MKPGTDPFFQEPDSNQDLRIADIEWATADALPFALCLWDMTLEDGSRRAVSVAMGNIVLADHGQTIANEQLPPVPESNVALTKVRPSTANACKEQDIDKTAPRYRPLLKHSPVTQQAPYDPENPPASAIRP